MHLRYYSMWGYCHPAACGADVVAANHLDYFRRRGWTVDCLLVNDAQKRAFAEAFREKYGWLRSVTLLDLPPASFTLRDLLFAHERAADLPHVARALAEPADLFLTNCVYTTPLLRRLPRSCKRILETHGIMSQQFAQTERYPPLTPAGEEQAACRPHPPGPADDHPLARARQAFLLRTELDLYRLYDQVLMINEQELELVRGLGASNACLVPQAYEPPPALPAAGAEHDLIFVGSSAPSNVRAIHWFYRQVYVPYLWRHRVRLAIVGPVCDHVHFRDAYVSLLRRVDSLAPLYGAAKLAVVPVLDGTGLPVKTLEALAMGCATVTTPAGARGVDDAAGAYVKLDMVADPQAAAAAILDLLASPGRRGQFQTAAREYARRCFSRECYDRAMDRVVASVGLGADAGARAA